MTSPAIVLSTEDYTEFAESICSGLDAQMGTIERRRFPDGERYQRICTSVIDREVILVGGTHTDDATMALYDLATAAVHYGAYRLSLVVPYFGYSTMERAVKPGEVVTAKVRARLLSSIPPASAGNRILLLDLHSEGIPHYFEDGLAAIHVYAKSALIPAIRAVGGDNFMLGSTDAGRAKWVESLANDLGVDAGFIIKRRIDGSHTEVLAVTGNVSGRTVVIYDDMIRTGGSLLGAGRSYQDAGARQIIAICTHGIFPGDAFERLTKSGVFERVISTDSHPRACALAADGLELVPVAHLFVEALKSRSR